MKIEMYEKERSTITAFAEKHDLVMEIHERTPRDMGSRWLPHLRFYAHFKGCEVKDGPILTGTFGNGATPEAAIADYAREISGKLLVIRATAPERRELYAPILI